MIELDYANMIEAGVHFGHQKKRWNPKFKTYLYKHLHSISIIDLERTRACMETAAKFLTECVKKGAHILFVGTKKQAQEIVREVAQSVEMPFCANRWLGGCLTNFETIKTSLAKYQRFLQMEESGELNKLPKKEGAVIRREMVRMQRSFEGIRNLTHRPDILVIVDARHEAIAIREAKRLQIPVVGIVDTNSDPTLINFPIPANDDSSKSIRLILEYLQEAVAQGLELRKLEKMSRKDVPANMATHTKPLGKKDASKAVSKATRSEDELTQK
ncbi:MAG: 30S ribosomal protein S2 [Puniceicoccales bacterium]|jgi:small subunit ribosomal protein S2|nr:30S ribosomal protein S2 [Puniceicoccales bacterium]